MSLIILINEQVLTKLNIFYYFYLYVISKTLSYNVIHYETERKKVMINEVYGIYDHASECYVQFMNFQNEKIARMTFEKLFKERRLQMPLLYDYPNTFSVDLIATFDDSCGLFENISPNKLLLNFGSLVPAESVSV